MAESGEFRSAPAPGASWSQGLAESFFTGLLQGRRGRIVWANAKLAQWIGEKASSDLVGRALDTLVMDAGRGLPNWASRSMTENAVECWLLRREEDPLTVAVRCLGGGGAAGESWWEVQDFCHHEADDFR